ncbi:MAG: anti-sigma factor, partial [Gammaproteobacteria bacterium]
ATPRTEARKMPFWSDLTFWRGAAFASLLAVAVLGVYRFAPVEYASGMPYYMAVLENQQQTPMIVATAEPEPQRLKVMMMHAPDIAADQDWELWAVPKEGGKPMSLGLLARNKETMLMLGDDCWRMIKHAHYLAVSSEPLGGSTTGGPSGPVMYKGQLVTFI